MADTWLTLGSFHPDTRSRQLSTEFCIVDYAVWEAITMAIRSRDSMEQGRAIQTRVQPKRRVQQKLSQAIAAVTI